MSASVSFAPKTFSSSRWPAPKYTSVIGTAAAATSAMVRISTGRASWPRLLRREVSGRRYIPTPTAIQMITLAATTAAA